MSESMITQTHDNVLVLINNNPAARNALTPDFYLSLQNGLQQAAEDKNIGAIVLTGASNYFCSGGDLNQLIKRRELPESERRQRIEVLHNTIRAVRNCPKPVIAAVDGGASGAGVSLALACDLLVMASDAYMSLAYVKVGLSPDGGATSFLSELMPRQLLTELLLTGDRITAQRLHNLGAVNLLAESDAALPEAISLAQRMATGPERAMMRIKSLAQSAYKNSLDDQLDAEASFMAKSLGDTESTEGIKAFFDKRKADYLSLRN